MSNEDLLKRRREKEKRTESMIMKQIQSVELFNIEEFVDYGRMLSTVEYHSWMMIRQAAFFNADEKTLWRLKNAQTSSIEDILEEFDEESCARIGAPGCVLLDFLWKKYERGEKFNTYDYYMILGYHFGPRIGALARSDPTCVKVLNFAKNEEEKDEETGEKEEEEETGEKEIRVQLTIKKDKRRKHDRTQEISRYYFEIFEPIWALEKLFERVNVEFRESGTSNDTTPLFLPIGVENNKKTRRNFTNNYNKYFHKYIGPYCSIELRHLLGSHSHRVWFVMDAHISGTLSNDQIQDIVGQTNPLSLRPYKRGKEMRDVSKIRTEEVTIREVPLLKPEEDGTVPNHIKSMKKQTRNL